MGSFLQTVQLLDAIADENRIKRPCLCTGFSRINVEYVHVFRSQWHAMAKCYPPMHNASGVSRRFSRVVCDEASDDLSLPGTPIAIRYVIRRLVG
jgi:hypothetical protein